MSTSTLMKKFSLTVAGSVCILIGAINIEQAQAALIQNDFGLDNPEQTITFDEFVFPGGTPISDEYTSLGVEFSPNLFYNTLANPFPNINGNVLSNFPDNSFSSNINPFAIKFTEAKSEAAFAMSTALSGLT